VSVLSICIDSTAVFVLLYSTLANIIPESVVADAEAPLKNPISSIVPTASSGAT